MFVLISNNAKKLNTKNMNVFNGLKRGINGMQSQVINTKNLFNEEK